MRQYIPVITLALLGAFALAVVSGGLFPADNLVHAQNSAPEFTEGDSANRSVPENTPPGTNIGDPVSATDEDGDTLTYSLVGQDEDSFDIDPSTGQLLTKAALDHENSSQRTLIVTVTVTDPSDVSDMVNVVVMVSDVDEPLPAPAAPTVTSGSDSTSLEVHWDAPDVTGREPITDYDAEYKKATETDYTEASHSGTDTTASISQLDAGTVYHVRVRAENAEGKGAWSLVGTGASNGDNNAVPSFSGASATEVNVAENTPAGQNIDAAITATDTDSTTLVHSLEGRDADAFDIVPSSGQILTKSPLNFEEKEEYSVLVKVDDGDGGSAVKPITIMVTNVTELPSAPGKPTVDAGDDDEDTTDVDESTTTLEVTWDAPENTGPPIDGQGSAIYTVEYREGDSGRFNTVSATIDYEERSVTIASLTQDTSYEVRVRAHNGEGESPFSQTGEGMTEAGNRAPEFSTETTTRSIQENTPTGRNVGARVSATDRDGDTLTYSLDETDAETFNIDELTGQIKTKAALNYEAACGDNNQNEADDESECTYSVTVKAEDEFGEGTIDVTITVTDQNEVPSAPQKPTVTSVMDDATTTEADESTTQLSVSWHAPENMGPSISLSDYEVQYRVRNIGSYSQVEASVAQDVDDGPITFTITGLTVHTQYEVQVRATNDEGTGHWSASGLGWTNTEGNSLPVFTEGNTATRMIDENTPGDQAVGLPVRANDGANDNDPRTYSMEGADADSFNINRSTGQITTKTGVTYNHEAKPSYSVMVKAEDVRRGSATIQVTITITDVDGEAPEAPVAPTVTTNEDDLKTPGLDESTSTLDVSWNEPTNTGPPIDRYDLQYRKKDSGNTFESIMCQENGEAASMKCFEDREVTIKGANDEGLEDGATYEVQVGAFSPEATSGGPWSDPGEGVTVEANNRPEFSSGTSATRSVGENAQSRQNVGAQVAATDRDADRLTYSLGGPGEDSFTIDARTGQIRTSSALNYEERDSYSVTVKADDGTDTRNSFAAISVTIMVNNVDEPPSKPAAPSVAGISGSTDSVLVMWEEPSNMGPPITDYDVQYREGASGNIKPWPHFGLDMSTIITGLSASKSYQFQVQARNAEGPSLWSSTASGRPDPDPANNPPVYTGGVRDFRVEENSEAGVNVGEPVTASDQDRGDTLTYSLEGADSASFEIVSVSGQIQTKADVDYNYEATKNSYSVTVRAADDRGGSDTESVTIAVTDSGDDEPPETPGAPTVEATSNSSTSIDVSWTAPQNPGPRITDYDYQYKESSSSSWTVVDNTTITRTAVTISSLNPQTSYDVQVRARNADGLSAWSDTGTGSTSEPVANRAPVFSEGASTTRIVSETAQASSPVGAPVTATDADNDTLVYSLDGTDASSFDITSSAGQLLVGAGTVLDASTKATYSVTVVANDGTVTATIDVTITVVAVSDVVPSVPDAPTVSPNADSATSLDVSWVAPANQGPPITDYDYRYRIARTPGGISIVHQWTEVDDTAITDTMVTIENLTTGTSYEVQIRATNVSGMTDWSESGTGTPTESDTNNPPEFDAPSTTRNVPENASAGTPIGEPVAATDADNDTLTYSLEGTDAASFDITPATGQVVTRVALDAGTKSTYTVTVVATDPSDASARITVTITVTSVQDRCGVQGAVDPANIDLASDCEALLDARDVLVGLGSPLNWSVSTPIAQWDGVTVDGTPMRVTTLDLRKMRLKGMISSDLSRVTALKELYLQDNHLTGPIPSELGSMTALTHLYAGNNDLSGAIPSQMGSMTELSQLRLRSNDLSGPLPAALGSLTNLTYLLLSDNDLSGSIPSQIGDMSSLYWLDVGQNNISGTLPAELGNLSQLGRLYVYENDLTGSIPSTLGNLTRLTHIVAQENDLSGSIPVQLGNMSALVWMGLYDNDLSGAIPTQLSRLSNLQWLYLSNNDLTGTIPPALGNLPSLTNLWLNDNGLSGTIPSELDQLTNLVRWRMRGNDFTGCVPADLAAIRNSDFDELGLPVCSGS